MGHGDFVMVEVTVVPMGKSGIKKPKSPKSKKSKIKTHTKTSRKESREGILNKGLMSLEVQNAKSVENGNKPYTVARTDTSSASEKISVAPSYHQKAASTVSRMQADNAKENARISRKELRKMVLKTIAPTHPHLSKEELHKMADDLLHEIMKKRTSKPPLKPEISPEVAAVLRDRKRNRKSIVAKNRQRRLMDKPLSKSDKEWINKTSPIKIR